MLQLQNFRKTRFRIATWYAGVMGGILIVCALVGYHAIVQERMRAIQQNLEILLTTLHDGIEPFLRESGQLNPEVEKVLPGICRTDQNCFVEEKFRPIHVLGVAQQTDYYIRLFNPQQKIVAFIGKVNPPTQKMPVLQPQITTDQMGVRHYQVAVELKTLANKPWGYLQIGKSLQENDQYLQHLRYNLLLGVTLACLVIALASWWLAGLSIYPITQSYRQVQQFTADAAHELRTPLATLRASIDAVLREPNLSEESRPQLQVIQRQSRRLAKLTQDLLLLSRFDLQENILSYSSCSLNDIVSDLVEEFSPFALESKITLSADLPLEEVTIFGDLERLYQVFSNLIVNAIQHTPAQGSVLVTLAQRNSQSAEITVRDTGVGISLEDLPHLFDRFYRIEHDRSRDYGGVGLGLAIVKSIVQAHHGQIQVSSQSQKGSQFSVLIPLVNKH